MAAWAFQFVGPVPRRRPGAGWLPAPGWDAAYDWQGYVPWEELPHEFHPPEGRVWSANNPPRPADQLPFASEFLDGYRAARIGQALAATAPHSVEAARALQADRKSLALLSVRDHLLALAPAGDQERALLALIRRWDGRMEPASVAAAVVAATYSRLLDAVLRARLGEDVALYLGNSHAIPNVNLIAGRAASLLTGLLNRAPADWFGPVGPSVEGRSVWIAALTRAFRDGVAMLRERLGEDQRRWTWGRCHQLTLVHGLGQVPALARLFNVGPIPFGGEANTVCQGSPLATDPFAPVTAIPALRLIVADDGPAHGALRARRRAVRLAGSGPRPRPAGRLALRPPPPPPYRPRRNPGGRRPAADAPAVGAVEPVGSWAARTPLAGRTRPAAAV